MDIQIDLANAILLNKKKHTLYVNLMVPKC